ncbi:MAG: TolC family protein, partial [Candidatus Eremiobacteraeota bacterium]|nr:TolC family protein [Candidatus Eremiobacteraeota bacterium]
PNVSGTVGLTRSDTLVGSSSPSRSSTPGVPQSTGSFGNGGSTSLTADATLRQLIYDGGRTRTQILAAGQGANAGSNTYRRQLQTLAFTVAQNYFNALQSEAAVALDQQIVEQNLVQERLVEAQIRAGTVARADLSQALFPVAVSRVNLIRAQGAELVADATFASSLGLNADTAVRPATGPRVDSTQTLLRAQPLDYSAAVTRALLLRPDYAASQNTLQQAQYALKAAKLGRFPTLSGNASITSGSTFPNGGGFRAGDGIGASLNIPIFDQGITNAQTEQAAATLENAQALQSSSELSVQLSVRQALINLVSAQAALVQAQAELAQAETAVRSSQAQYRAGVTTLPLLLNAEVSLTQAQTDRLNAIYTLRQAEQTYLYALGEIDTTTLDV